MRELIIDIETASSEPLARSGVYRYAESEDFRVLLFGYSIDGSPAEAIDLERGQRIPEEILKALADESVLKWAFNASFERICLSRHLGLPKGEYLAPSSWRCVMIWSAYLGLPLSLDGVGQVLGLDKKKLSEGKDLVRHFTIPCSPTAANGCRTWNRFSDDPDKWERFVAYNRRDVEAELEIMQRLSKHPVPDFVWEEYTIDQDINDRGVLLDMDLVERAIKVDSLSRAELMLAMRDRTGLENPNSASQMKTWLSSHGIQVETLGKKAVAALMKEAPDDLHEALRLRQQLARSSVRKYISMSFAACADGRARGMFQFYGANRTGRWSGRKIQMQNLPQNHLPDLRQARDLVRAGDHEMLKALYLDVPDTLSQLIRTAFIPRPGCKFIVSDFSAIEARVLSYLAGERWRLDVLEANGDIYCASASAMFKVPVVKHGINGHLRQKGKIAELALGYGGSVGALTAMGALDMGLKEDELKSLVDAWRLSNPHIVQLWWDVDKAAMKAIKDKTTDSAHGIVFSCMKGMLFITLPSGRRLAYARPRIGLNDFGSGCITYEGIGVAKRWERLQTYGPKLVENIVQATSRDILANAMKRLGDRRIVMHIHDELVIEAPRDESLEDVCRLMGETPGWAPGLVLRADGCECDFYQKD